MPHFSKMHKNLRSCVFCSDLSEDRTIDDGQTIGPVGRRRVPGGHRQRTVRLSRCRAAGVHHIRVRGGHRLAETVGRPVPERPGGVHQRRRR